MRASDSYYSKAPPPSSFHVTPTVKDKAVTTSRRGCYCEYTRAPPPLAPGTNQTKHGLASLFRSVISVRPRSQLLLTLVSTTPKKRHHSQRFHVRRLLTNRRLIPAANQLPCGFGSFFKSPPFDAAIHMQGSAYKMLRLTSDSLWDAAHPSRDSPNTSRRFAHG